MRETGSHDFAAAEFGWFGLELQFVGDDARPTSEWRHFDLVHAQARMTIEDDVEFPVFANAVMTGTDESARVVSDGNVVAGALPNGMVFVTVLCAAAVLVTLLWLHWKRML